MGREDDEEKRKKTMAAIYKGQLTNTVGDVFSPIPILDRIVQYGTSSILDATQDALDVEKDDRLEIYSGGKQDILQSLGLLGITASRVNQLYEAIKLSSGGSYEDNYGRERYLSEEDRNALRMLIPISIISNIGLTPSEVNSIVRSSIEDAKRNASTKKEKKEETPMGLNKEDLKRYYPDIYKEYYGEGTEYYEEQKLKREADSLEREMKDEFYQYVPKKSEKKSKEFGSGSTFGKNKFGK